MATVFTRYSTLIYSTFFMKNFGKIAQTFVRSGLSKNLSCEYSTYVLTYAFSRTFQSELHSQPGKIILSQLHCVMLKISLSNNFLKNVDKVSAPRKFQISSVFAPTMIIKEFKLTINVAPSPPILHFFQLILIPSVITGNLKIIVPLSFLQDEW